MKRNSVFRISFKVLLVTCVSLFVGILLGVGTMTSYTHVIWPVLAGSIVGMLSALAFRSYVIAAAFSAGVLIVLAAVLTVVIWQYQVGWWPITDPLTIEQYGSTAVAVMFVSVILFLSVCVPCLVAAVVVALARRRAV